MSTLTTTAAAVVMLVLVASSISQASSSDYRELELDNKFVRFYNPIGLTNFVTYEQAVKRCGGEKSLLQFGNPEEIEQTLVKYYEQKNVTGSYGFWIGNRVDADQNLLWSNGSTGANAQKSTNYDYSNPSTKLVLMLNNRKSNSDNGKWDEQPTGLQFLACELKKCHFDPVDFFEHGKRIGGSNISNFIKEGEHVSIVCDAGYEVTDDVATCTASGVLTQRRLSCRPKGSCVVPPTFVNGGQREKKKQHYENGDDVTIDCDVGSTSVMVQSSRCTNGKFQPRGLLCRKFDACENLPVVIHGIGEMKHAASSTPVQTSDVLPHGGDISISCPPSYEPNVMRSTCNDGHFTSGAFLCTKSKCMVSAEMFVNGHNLNPLGGAHLYDIGDDVSIACDEGSKPYSDVATSTCGADGEFSPSFLYCSNENETTTAANAQNCETVGASVNSAQSGSTSTLGMLIATCIIGFTNLLLVALIVKKNREAERISDDISAFESHKLQPTASRTQQKPSSPTGSSSSDTRRHEDNDRVVESLKPIEEEAAVGGGADQQAHGNSRLNFTNINEGKYRWS